MRARVLTQKSEEATASTASLLATPTSFQLKMRLTFDIVSLTVVCTRCFHSRGSNPNDPPTVIHAREQEKQIIAKWLQQ